MSEQCIDVPKIAPAVPRQPDKETRLGRTRKQTDVPKIVAAVPPESDRGNGPGSCNDPTDTLKKLGCASNETCAGQNVTDLEFPRMSLSLHLIDPQAVRMVSAEIAQRYRIIPVMVADEVLIVAMCDPRDVVAIDNVKLGSGLAVKPVVCHEDEILQAIDYFFGHNGKHLRVQEARRDSNIKYMSHQGQNEEESEADEAEDAPIIRLFNTTLARAVEEGASDIHVEPEKDLGRVRYRLDGVLHEVNVLPRLMVARLVSRIKILSSLDIAEKRVPQDGRFFVRYKEKDVDLRIATLPTIYGESCVVRLLDQSKSGIRLEDSGFAEDQRELIIRALSKPSGLVLVTGPTGSGKTTTLYAMLNHLNSLEKKIITLEDPVEYRLSVINQVCTNPVAGLTFATGLRSILRNDPDIVLVGEIRDRESAMIAVQASLTGHLLLSTLHTTGSAQALMRLLDLGVEPFYVRDVVETIVAQRLVRVLCVNCKEPYKPSPEVRVRLGDADNTVTAFKPVGCRECYHAGYKGRTAVFEILIMTKELRRILRPDVTTSELKEHAGLEGMKTLWEAAVEKVLRGQTSVEEISRCVPADSEPVPGKAGDAVQDS